MLFPGEKEAIKKVLEYGERYGYGNLIAHLRKAWAEMLIRKCGIDKDAAIMATNSDPYEIAE